MTALKKKSEKCEEQLRRMCKNIAAQITAGKKDPAIWMYDVYDVEWITHNDHSYKAARLMVAGGGPNIWVNTQTEMVEGYWGADEISWHFQDNIGLDDYLEELHASK